MCMILQHFLTQHGVDVLVNKWWSAGAASISLVWHTVRGVTAETSLKATWLAIVLHARWRRPVPQTL
jgi:hypothetical protein